MMQEDAMFRILCCGLPAILAIEAVHASGVLVPGDRLLLQTSVWTRHYDPEPDHTNNQDLINIEWQAPPDARFDWQHDGAAVRRMPWLAEVRWLAGGAAFRNSFGQRSAYVYGGGRYDLAQRGHTRVYAKVTAGLMHGYRGEYRDKIPFNRFGVAPAVLPALGVEYRRMNLEMIPFGAAGVMLNLGFYLN
jgi:hypothetical protein